MKPEQRTEHRARPCSKELQYIHQATEKFVGNDNNKPVAACLFEAHGQSLLHVIAFNCDLSNQERSIAPNLNTRGTPADGIAFKGK